MNPENEQIDRDIKQDIINCEKAVEYYQTLRYNSETPDSLHRELDLKIALCINTLETYRLLSLGMVSKTKRLQDFIDKRLKKNLEERQEFIMLLSDEGVINDNEYLTVSNVHKELYDEI
jgi:hypothetical protein